jgi:hypothetical protein
MQRRPSPGDGLLLVTELSASSLTTFRVTFRPFRPCPRGQVEVPLSVQSRMALQHINAEKNKKSALFNGGV